MPNSVLQILLALSTILKLSNAFPIDFQNKFDYASLMEKSKTTWDVLKFIATNYVAHAFTVNTVPGYGAFYSLLFSVYSLAFPYIGLVTACRSLELVPMLERDPLKRAAKAGALCMVARTKYWKGPNDNNKASNDNNKAPKVWSWQRGTTDSRAKRLYYEGLELEPISQRYVGIHGICSLPRSTDKPTSEAACRSEYIMVRVPMDFKVQWQAIRPQIGERYIFRSHKKWEKSEERRVALEAERDGGQSQGARTPGEESSDPKGVDGIEREISGDEIKPQEKWIKKSNCDISSIHSIPKKVVALVQLYSAIQVIWEAKDSEYGYAAYQLTLIPYALMSFLNIVNSLLTPTYPMLYMIESETMKEARSKGGIFEGTIGKLCELSIAEPENTPDGNEKTAEPENKPDGNEKSIREICADLDGIQFKRIDMDQIQEHKEHKLSEMICGASKYIFTHLIGEHIRREIYIARFHWREPGAMLRSNVRRIFNRAPKDTPSIIVPKDTPSIMVSPFGCPILRKLRNRDTFMTVIADILLTISLVAPYIATYYLTGYTNGKSTVFQRALFVMWLVLGQVSHFFQRMFWGYLQARVVPLGTKWLWGVLAVGAIPAMIFMLVPAGGILMVANMYWLKLKPPSASSSATAAISSTASIIATSSIIATASISAITSITATASVGAIVSITATASVGAITSDGASASITASTSAAGLLTL